MNKVYDELGSLLLFSSASSKDVDLLVKIIARGRYSYVALLRELVKDDASLLKLLDVMASLRVQFPDRRKIYKCLEKVTIYNFCSSRNFSEESYRIMSKQYKKRVPQVKAIVETMRKFLEKQEDSWQEVDILNIIEKE